VKPRRVADSPTKHRPQMSVRFGLGNERSPGCNLGLHHGGECGNHRSCARERVYAALDDSTVPTMSGGG
jgi:hypothetical protein